MSPSSPVSVGMLPSNRTLALGSEQVDMLDMFWITMLEQFPVAEEPLTDTTSSVINETVDGKI